MAESRVAIITAAASGMGLAVTKHLLSKGWKVAMFDINKAQGEALAAELGSSAIFFQADVTDYDAQCRGFEAVWAEWKRLDFVAANAGIIDNFSLYQPLSTDKPPPKPDLKTVDVDLNGTVYTVYLALHYLRKNATPGGKITLTASSAALYPLDTVPLYTAAKHAVVGLTRAMAPVLKAENITINCFCPGIIDTALTAAMMNHVPKQYVTPISTVLKAYDRFIDGDETGCTAEVSLDDIYLRGPPEYPDEAQKWQAENLGPIGRKIRAEPAKKQQSNGVS